MLTKSVSVLLAIFFALSSMTANAVLERVGPVDPANGFPKWYMDTTGVALELCLPLNAVEVDGAYCLLLPGDPPQVPEIFPNAFFDEHFYAGGEASFVNPRRDIKLIMHLEAAFAGGQAKAGDQIAFTRIRLQLNPAPTTGTYRFIHPYGEESIEAIAGDRIYFTEDVGICGNFECAMQGRFGPFLLPSTVSGGAELPPVTGPVPGKLYIADPARLGPITGSPLPDFLGNDGVLRNHNIFRIEGPPGSELGGPGIDFLETYNFSLMGRIFTGQIPGKVTVDRASYTKTPTTQQVDVFAKAFSTAASRFPAGVRPAGVAPVTSFFSAPCGTVVNALGEVIGLTAPTGTILETLMAAQNNYRWGQIFPDPAAPTPDSVCVKDNSGVDAFGLAVPAYHQLPVNDVVTVNQAIFDAANSTLTVSAASSDQVSLPTLTLTGFPGDATSTSLVNGTLTLAGITTPPTKVLILSSARGVGFEDVVTSGAPTVAPTLIAGNDSATTPEDTAVIIPVITGDALGGAQIDPNVTPVSLAIVGGSTKATLAINNGTGAITYTPVVANFNGVDTFTYVVTNNGLTSNLATVTVNVTPVNDAPVAVADTATGVSTTNTPITTQVLANDTDVDGDVLTIAAGSLTAPVGPVGSASSVVANANGTVTFTGNTVGTYVFTYRATDGIALSAPASVTVTLSSAEIVNVTQATYVTRTNRWKFAGTSSVTSAPRTLTARFAGLVGGLPCNASGRLIGSGVALANTNAFAFDVFTQVNSAIDPRKTNCNAVRIDSTPFLGVDLSTPILVQ